MALEGPRIVYTRKEEETSLSRALRLAREIEELLEETTESPISSGGSPPSSAHSGRMARAMAAGLVDELVNLDRADKKPKLC